MTKTTTSAVKAAQRPGVQPAKGAAKGQKGDGEGQTEERGDPLLDLTDAAVKKMITRAKQRGFITLDELNKVMPSEQVSSEQIEDTMSMLSDMGINVVEDDEVGEEGDRPVGLAGSRAREEARREPGGDALDRLPVARRDLAHRVDEGVPVLAVDVADRPRHRHGRVLERLGEA